MSALLLLLALGAPTLAHGGHASPRPWDACAERALGEPCQWQDDQQALYRGTCRRLAEDLVCVRNQPIAPAARPRTASLTWIGALLLGGFFTRGVLSLRRG